MRVVDLFVHHDRLEDLRAHVEGCGHRLVVIADGEDAFVRIVVQNGDTDEFLEEIRTALRKDEPCQEHYVVLEPVAVEPMREESEDDNANGNEESHAGSDEIEGFVEDGARLTRSFLVLSGLSGVLAAGGLLRDSVAVLVGAMVLAPLFKPLALAGVSVVLGRPRKAIRGLLWLALSLGMAAGAGLVVTLLTPDRSVTDLLLSRTGTSAFDVVIALAAGLAMAFVLVKRDSMAMVGIVVAASLMPVAAAVGVAAAIGRMDLVAGGVFTLASNVCGIVLGLVVGLRVEELQATDWRRSSLADLLFKRSVAIGTAMALTLIGVGVWTYVTAREERPRQVKAEDWEGIPGVIGTFPLDDGRLCVLVEESAAGRFTTPRGQEDEARVVLVRAASSSGTPDPQLADPAATGERK